MSALEGRGLFQFEPNDNWFFAMKGTRLPLSDAYLFWLSVSEGCQDKSMWD